MKTGKIQEHKNINTIMIQYHDDIIIFFISNIHKNPALQLKYCNFSH